MRKITMDTNMSIYFYNFLSDLLNYNANIIPFEDNTNYDMSEDYKSFIPRKDIQLKFIKDKTDKDYPIAVYCRTNTDKEWEYLDNIINELYEREFKFIKRRNKNDL